MGTRDPEIESKALLSTAERLEKPLNEIWKTAGEKNQQEIFGSSVFLRF